MKRVVLFSGEYPVLSETFVWREAESLRQQGIALEVATLRAAKVPAKEVVPARWVLFNNGVPGAILNSIKALIATPARSMKLLNFAAKIAIGNQSNLKTKSKILFQGLCALGIAREVKTFAPDWIHCHFAHAPATYAMFVAKYLDIPWSFTGHANDLFQRRILLEEKLNDAAGVACISRWHKAFYTNVSPSSTAKMRVIRCGVDIPDIANKETNQTIKIIAVGRLIEKKGFHILLQACAGLDDIGELEINIIGDGPENERLHELARELPTNIKVNFLGALTHREILSMVAKSDLFVMPCIDDKNGDRDGIPVSMMEAMAAGVPVLSGDLPAIRELIEDGVTGWIREAKPDSIEQAIRQISESKIVLNEVAEQAHQWVTTEFSTSVNTQRLIAMINGDRE